MEAVKNITDRIRGNVRIFLTRFLGAVLIMTAIAKLISAFNKALINFSPDPLLSFLSVRTVTLLAGVTELALGIGFWVRRLDRLHPKMALWFGSVLSCYRLGLLLIGYHGHCPCLGNATDWLPGSKVWVQPALLGIILALLLYGGYYTWQDLSK